MSAETATEVAKKFRRQPTEAEAIMWGYLRGRALEGLKFRRQHPIGGCIADFYCDEARLIVEVDGAVHLDPNNQAQDQARDAWFERHGITTLRFTNTQIQLEVESVLTRISASARERMARPLVPSPSPPEWRGVPEGRGEAEA